MNKLKAILILIIIIFQCQIIIGQDRQFQDFWNMLQTYSQTKDTNLINKTISYLILPTTDYSENEAFLMAFFGAIFTADSLFRLDFQKELYRLNFTQYQQLFTYLLNTHIDTIYSRINLSPTYNDMIWASFFASGDFKFIDRIINNMNYASNRQDMNLFMTGQTAKWSLCANAKQYPNIKSYLLKLKNMNTEIDDILKKSPNYFRQELMDVLNEQKKKGIWNF